MELMKISNSGLSLIKRYEGCKLAAYKDSVGVWTIGWGNTSHAKAGMTITQQQAETFLKNDIKPIETLLNGMGVTLKQNQFDALCSFIFNLGVGNFNSSTMKKYIVAKCSDIDVTDQMVKWCNAGGRPLLGLRKRRVSEANMYLGYTKYIVDASGNIKKK
jgi:lysozyme